MSARESPESCSPILEPEKRPQPGLGQLLETLIGVIETEGEFLDFLVEIEQTEVC